MEKDFEHQKENGLRIKSDKKSKVKYKLVNKYKLQENDIERTKLV